MINFKDLKGKTISGIEVRRKREDDGDEIIIALQNGDIIKMYHLQDCCEEVFIEDINGDLNDLIGHELQMAEKVTQELDLKHRMDESGMWTFYKLATVKGTVVIRWIATSNGSYSEEVDLKLIKGGLYDD